MYDVLLRVFLSLMVWKQISILGGIHTKEKRKKDDELGEASEK